MWERDFSKKIAITDKKLTVYLCVWKEKKRESKYIEKKYDFFNDYITTGVPFGNMNSEWLFFLIFLAL